jgi:hypothetical protein
MPPPRRFLPAAKTEFTERTIHNSQTKTAHHADAVQQGVVIAAKPLSLAKPLSPAKPVP